MKPRDMVGPGYHLAPLLGQIFLVGILVAVAAVGIIIVLTLP